MGMYKKLLVKVRSIKQSYVNFAFKFGFIKLWLDKNHSNDSSLGFSVAKRDILFNVSTAKAILTNGLIFTSDLHTYGALAICILIFKRY